MLEWTVSSSCVMLESSIRTNIIWSCCGHGDVGRVAGGHFEALQLGIVRSDKRDGETKQVQPTDPTVGQWNEMHQI